MPQVVAAAAYYFLDMAILTALGTAGVTALSYAVTVGAYYAFGTYQARKARRAAQAEFNASLEDRLVMTATTDAMRSRLYGRVRNVDGVLFKATHGDKKQFYTFVVAVAGHKVAAIEAAFFNDERLTLDAAGNVTTAPYATTSAEYGYVQLGPPNGAGGGSVVLPHDPLGGSVSAVQAIGEGDAATSVTPAVSVVGRTVTFTGAQQGVGVGITYQHQNVSSKARVRFYLGTDSQNLSTDLGALGIPNITPQHRFSGIACMLVTLTYDQEAFTQGVPTMSAIVRGAECFDPRDGVTRWTQNPALIARDWALYPFGGGAVAADLDDLLIVSSANACDVVVNFPRGTPGGGIISGDPRYTYQCDLVAPGGTDPTQILNEIVSSMAGKYAWAGGILKIKAGHYTPPVCPPIDESWLTDQSGIEITAGVARIDLVNVYRPTIADGAHNWVLTPTEPVRAQAYIDADGVELPRDITLGAVSDAIHATHVCSCLLRDARQALTVRLPLNMRAYPLELFDTIPLTFSRFGWVAKEFEILTWEFSPVGGVSIVAKETAAAIWNPNTFFPVADLAPNTQLPFPWLVPAPTGVNASSGTAALTDGSIITRVRIGWDAYPLEAVRQSGQIEVQWAKAFGNLGAGSWQSATVDGSATELVLAGLQTNLAYLFRVRAINSVGVRSSWTIQLLHVVAPPPASAGTYSQEDPPTSPTDGDLWERPSVGIIYRWSAALGAWIEFGISGGDWTAIGGRPKTFRVVARGYQDAGAAHAPGFFLAETDVSAVVSISTNRSYNFARVRRSDGVVTFARQYDLYAPGSGEAGPYGPTDLTADLNATGSDSLVVVWSHDEPRQGRLAGGVPAAMYRHGASRAVFGSPAFASHSAYALIGIGACGEGNGFEAYQGGVPSNSWVDVAFMLLAGNLIVTGSGATPRTLADYSYTGSLDATTDVALVARGSAVVAGNYASKISGVNAWDSDVYSRDSFRNAGYVTCQIVSAGDVFFIGLNLDPEADQNFSSIDHAIYNAGGTLQIYQSGAPINANVGAAAANDVLAVVYDGSRVHFQRNGVDLIAPVAAAGGLRFFMDSSLYSPGAAMRNIRFGPMSANDWLSIGGVAVTTGQIAANAATRVYSDSFDGAGAAYATATVRTIAITPAADCTAEFTGTFVADNIYPDAANYGGWRVTPAGGGTPVYLGADLNAGLNKQQFTVADTVTLTGGVPYNVELYTQRGSGNPSIHIWKSTMRVTLVYR